MFGHGSEEDAGTVDLRASMPKSFKPINAADVEFYEGLMVMTVAQSLVAKPWDQLSHRSKQIALNKAVKAVQALLNDTGVHDRMRLFLRHRVDQ